MKTALVTGATSGIGLEIARSLASKNFTVFLGGRSAERLASAAEEFHHSARVFPVLMDVSSGWSLDAAFNEVAQRTGSLDVLVNNAAVLIDKFKPLLSFSRDEVEETFRTNALAPFFVTQKFLPLLPRGGRVIQISSNAGSVTRGIHEFAPLYSASKTMLNVLSLHLMKPLLERGIAINLVDPGRVQTRMGGQDAPRTVEQGADTAVWLATDAPTDITGKFFRDRKEVPF